MIQTVWSYVAIMLLAAGLFPSLETRYRWRVFSVLPPIVLTYLLVMALAVAGLWSATPEVQATQRASLHCLFMASVLAALAPVG